MSVERYLVSLALEKKPFGGLEPFHDLSVVDYDIDG